MNTPVKQVFLYKSLILHRLHTCESKKLKIFFGLLRNSSAKTSIFKKRHSYTLIEMHYPAIANVYLAVHDIHTTFSEYREEITTSLPAYFINYTPPSGSFTFTRLSEKITYRTIFQSLSAFTFFCRFWKNLLFFISSVIKKAPAITAGAFHEE